MEIFMVLIFVLGSGNNIWQKCPEQFKRHHQQKRPQEEAVAQHMTWQLL